MCSFTLLIVTLDIYIFGRRTCDNKSNTNIFSLDQRMKSTPKYTYTPVKVQNSKKKIKNERV